MMSTPEPAADPSLIFNGLKQILARLEQLIDEETEALLRHDMSRCDEFNQRKRLALLDLNRCSRSFESFYDHPLWQGISGTLRSKLRRNGELLHIHLSAVQEIAAILTRAMSEAESYGTYSLIRKGRRS